MKKSARFAASLLLLKTILADDQFRPSSGELVLANQTYLVNWNITYTNPVYDIFLEIPNMTPPYVSQHSVPSRELCRSYYKPRLIWIKHIT